MSIYDEEERARWQERSCKILGSGINIVCEIRSCFISATYHQSILIWNIQCHTNVSKVLRFGHDYI